MQKKVNVCSPYLQRVLSDHFKSLCHICCVIQRARFNQVYFFQKKFEFKKKLIEEGIEKNARAEILNVEAEGFLETEDGECSYNIRQEEIVQNVDVASAAKVFTIYSLFFHYK